MGKSHAEQIENRTGGIVSVSYTHLTDFGMGRICDTAPMTKEGRFRPWIKRAAIPMGVSHMLIYMFWVQDFPLIGRIIWVTVTFLLWGSIFYTACNIPYGSMASVITNVPTERTSLSTYCTCLLYTSSVLVKRLLLTK